MPPSRACGSLVLALLLPGACVDGTGVTAPADPSFAIAGRSGCYTVQFNVLATPVGPFAFVGDVAGDLEGTVLFQFDASSVTFAGITISNEGTAEWAITGGIIPDPLGFTTHFDNRNLNVDRPGSPGTQFENVGSHRAAAGVDVANLTYRGIFAFDPAPLADHAYRGTICP